MADADAERSLSGYLSAVAAGTATPGGGSVSAIVGALAAALGEMVANLTLGREQDTESAAALRPARDRLTVLREELAAAALEDERAYAAYRAAASLPRRTSAEKSLRAGAVQRALIDATTAPLRVAAAAAETAENLQIVAGLGNPHLRSDAALGALLAEVALRGALLNVRGNAAMLRDRSLARQCTDEARDLETRGCNAANAAYQTATAVDGPEPTMLSS